jgi:uncharacterized protein (TIGR03437 family)
MNRNRCAIGAVAALLLAGGLPAWGQTLHFNPTSLAFSAQSGSGVAQTRTLEVTTTDAAGAQVQVDFMASVPATTPWLSVSPQFGKTPASLTVTANPTGMQPGVHQGSVTVSIAGAMQNVPVTLNIGQLGATPASVSFAYQIGGAAPGGQTVQISSASTVAFSVTRATTSGGAWLDVAPAAGSAPGSITVSLNSTVLASLAPGSHEGAVTVTPGSGSTTPLQIPVHLAVATMPQLKISPAALSFGYQTGGTNNTVQQSLALSSTGAALSFAVGVNPVTGGNWLVVTPTSGVTPATLTVGVQPPAIAGTYTAIISILAPGASTTTHQVPVTLTVSTNPLLSLTPNALEFTWQMGAAAPASKTITPISTGAAMNYTVAAATATGAAWLTAITQTGVTPNPIGIGVNPAGLTPGTYEGTVTVTATGAGNPPQQVPVTLRVTNDALIAINGTATPATTLFNYQVGTALPAAQSLSISSSTGAPLNYTLAAGTASGGNWLGVLPASGATPGILIVSANPVGVPAGSHEGTITVTATDATGAAAPNSPLSVPVKFVVSENPLLNLSQTAITLTSVNGVVSPQTISLASTSATQGLNFNVAFTTTSGGPWLALGPLSGTTPSVINVSAVPGSLAPGNYSGSITITVSNPAGAAVANSPVAIPVSLQVAAGGLQVAPAALSFTMPAGGSAPAQNVNVSSSGAAFGYTATASANWIRVEPASGATPGQVAVSMNAATLAQGTYQGTVTIVAPGAANSPQTVQVNLTVGPAATLQLTPAALTFAHQVGAAAPQGQVVAVSSTPGSVSFNATVSTVTGGMWLSATPGSGQTPSNMTVSVNPAGLQAGTYTGALSIASAGATNSPQTVQVTLTVTAAAALQAAPANLTFTHQMGAQAPPGQGVTVSSTGGSLAFTATVSTVIGGNWLSVSPVNGQTASNLTVSVNPAGLQAGIYTGSISIASAASNSPQTVAVTLNVLAAPSPTVLAVANAASWAFGAVAPGEIVVIGGTNFGADADLRLTPQGKVATKLGDTEVLFDNLPAPLVYVRANQIGAVVPYEIAGRVSTRIQVRYKDATSTAVEVRVVDAAPAIFAMNQAGTGQGAILNEDWSLNGAANPAVKGKWVMIWATGEGQTDPRGESGRVTPTTGEGLAKPVLPVTVTIGGRSAPAVVAFSAPGSVAGVLQVNVLVPEEAPSGGAVPVVITVGEISSPSGVTMAVR